MPIPWNTLNDSYSVVKYSEDSELFKTSDEAGAYLAFMIWSSWLPRLRNTPPGNTSRQASRSRNTSSPFFPRSTKSPLNTYGFSVEGRPFLNIPKTYQRIVNSASIALHILQVKQNHYRPRQALRVPGVEASIIPTQHEGGKVSSPMQRAHLSTGEIHVTLIVISAGGWVGLSDIVLPEGLSQLQICYVN